MEVPLFSISTIRTLGFVAHEAAITMTDNAITIGAITNFTTFILISPYKKSFLPFQRKGVCKTKLY
jgi:hypothetical protein